VSTERITQTQRPLDPNVLQRNASNPAASVWVSASAGTGKTKVLTDRVLRLLLPQEDGTPGCAPHKILGLTFTKAAASEMAIRISETLSQWAITDDETLTKKIKNLLGRTPNTREITSARKLYTNVIDTPGRLKIMTIHAFCQSVLSRFPLESKLTPGFQLAEDRKAFEFLNQAKSRAFAAALSDKVSPLGQAVDNLSRTINEDQLAQLIASINSERGQLEKILDKHFGIDGFYTALCTSLDILPNQSSQGILAIACQDEYFDKNALQFCADTMAAGAKTDIKNAAFINAFLSADLTKRAEIFQNYANAFLKKDRDIRAKLITKKISDAHPNIVQAMMEEAERIQATFNAMKSADVAALTRDLLIFTNETLTHYTAIKAQHNMLDYEDLIFKTKHLMQTRGAWVHYKLDQGIDHILIDEAQDTNPEQWQIIESLCSEFFASHSAPEALGETNRTIFTVGDEKQSIYSFQRASPEEFDRMRTAFADKVTTAQKRWAKVDLNISFRSTKSVLAAVDATFKNPDVAKGLGIGSITHESFRRGQEGLVELWPLFESDQNEETARTWEPPIAIENYKSGSTKCAENIAETIEGWIKNNEILPSYNRAIEPGDIMVLVRTRNAFVNQLIRALKSKDIPVGGLDRIVLNDQLAVQDMLAAADFSLLQNDDLTLACLLKSPLIGMDEEALFTLAYDRKETLWEELRNSGQNEITHYLKSLISKSKTLTPYEFFADILQSPCPASPTKSGLEAFQKRLGIDALDALDELLNAAIGFEHDNTPSLQKFIQWQRGGANGGADIKRQSDSQNNQIRIMTVHGSKGLQAPIVFLPDTVSTPGLNPTQAGNRLLWPNQTGEELPLWAPRKEFENHAFTHAKENVLTRLNEEYRRLLYVAMTRAEERLYVTGYRGNRDIPDECWYTLVKNGLQSNTPVETIEGNILRLQNLQTKDADRAQKAEQEEKEPKPIPDWMYQNAPSEPHPPAPLMPSRPSGVEPTALSPLNADDNYRFRRGNITHKLLQFLPDLPSENRKTSMDAYLKTHANDLPASIQDNISAEVLKILNDEHFAPLFGKHSRAEVPITGLLNDGRLISGQIDRLLITENEILIIDFKSNRPPPNDPKDVPKIYYDQLKSYADTLKSIYPDRKIRCALLWTDGPNLMPIEI